jgi:4-amino-4-deoxy-L-arabinose transferase-like glycosyltransferase
MKRPAWLRMPALPAMTWPRAIGLTLALTTVVVVTANQNNVGIARDETVYMANGAHYAQWWLDLVTFDRKATITQTFGGPNATDNNREHPPLLKTLAGLSHRILFDKTHAMDELTAFRFPSALLHGLCVWLVYAMTLELWGLAEAIVAALCLLLLPRALFHAGLVCMDAPIMTMWFAAVYAYWRALDGRKWPWQAGVVFGLALATKHNAVILPGALGVHYLVIAWRAQGKQFLTYRWRVIVSLGVLGPLTFFVVWPWLWLDPIGHVAQWLKFHMTHVHYNFEYLGTNYNAAPYPWHVALVTTLFTVPAATLGAAAIGVGVWISRRGKIDRAPALLLGLSAAAAIAPFLMRTTPIFGAEKHWMPALPTICIAAGVGAVWAARQVARYVVALRAVPAILAERIAIGVVAGTLLLAAATETYEAQPYALTWYNALAGGAPGGADLGMNRQFWGVSARGILPELQRQPPGKVYTHDAVPAWGWYMRLGMLSTKYPDSGHEDYGIAQSQYALVIHEKHFNRHDYLIWKSYGTVRPIYVLRAAGVPIVSLYKRP